jgi:hypothetical protein
MGSRGTGFVVEVLVTAACDEDVSLAAGLASDEHGSVAALTKSIPRPRTSRTLAQDKPFQSAMR